MQDRISTAAFGEAGGRSFVDNVWYAVAWSREGGEVPFSRTICDVRLARLRTEEDRITALHDQCPHRFAPLSRGTIVGNIRGRLAALLEAFAERQLLTYRVISCHKTVCGI